MDEPAGAAGASGAEQPTITKILSKSTSFLREKGSATPRLDAELLVAEALGLSRVELYTNFDQPLNFDEVDRCRDLLVRRGRGEPVAYITGRAYFRNLTLRVDRSVLIPRPETEHVVEIALKYLMDRDWQPHLPEVLDLGTGSGAIVISLALSFPEARYTAGDASEAALQLARENSRTADAGQIDFIFSDMFDDLDPLHTFDLIVCNPPYISEEEWPTLPVSVREYEPREALFGGADGLDFYRRLALEAPQFMRPGGCLVAEIGHDQGPAVTELMGSTGLFDSIDLEQDYAGHDRVLIALREDLD
jgi:release factor glutamine methyltransferase